MRDCAGNEVDCVEGNTHDIATAGGKALGQLENEVLSAQSGEVCLEVGRKLFLRESAENSTNCPVQRAGKTETQCWKIRRGKSSESRLRTAKECWIFPFL